MIGLLAFGILVSFYDISVEQHYLDLLDKLADGVDVTYAQATAADSRRSSAGILDLVTSVPTVIAFIVWFRRAYRNLGPLGAGPLRYKAGWAVGGWFVPILSLWRPKQIANDIWRASDPAISDTDDPADWRGRQIGAVVGWWWALFVIVGLVGNTSARLFLRAETLREQQSAAHVDLAADFATVVAGIVAIMFVRKLTARQDARIDRPGPGTRGPEPLGIPFTDE